MVDLLTNTAELGPAFLIGFAEGFLIAAVVVLIKAVVKVFKRIVS